MATALVRPPRARSSSRPLSSRSRRPRPPSPSRAKIGAYEDCEKVLGSKTMRAGKGKMRNRRFTQRRGVLVIYGNDGLTRALRNLPGVETADVSSLNLLQLAPGGHVGRFASGLSPPSPSSMRSSARTTSPAPPSCTNAQPARLPVGIMTNSDLSRLINSDEVQSKINAPKQGFGPGGAEAQPARLQVGHGCPQPGLGRRQARS